MNNKNKPSQRLLPPEPLYPKTPSKWGTKTPHDWVLSVLTLNANINYAMCTTDSAVRTAKGEAECKRPQLSGKNLPYGYRTTVGVSVFPPLLPIGVSLSSRQTMTETHTRTHTQPVPGCLLTAVAEVDHKSIKRDPTINHSPCPTPLDSMPQWCAIMPRVLLLSASSRSHRAHTQVRQNR